MDDINNILSIFKTLKPRARQAVYLNLLNNLTNNEWRDLTAAVNKRTFQYDILASLPLEIAAQITQYLDLSELIVLQRVSRKWQTLLSSHHILSTTLHRTGHGHVPSDPSSTLSLIKQRLRLEKADPVRLVRYRSPLKYPNNGTTGLSKMDYADGRCASIENGVTVAVFCLRAGKVVKRFDTMNREPIYDIRISGGIVGVVTQGGRCYAWDIHTEESYPPFRLPSIRYTNFIMNGHQIAFSFPSPPDTSIIHWTPKSTQTLQVPLGLILLSLHPTAEELTTIHFPGNSSLVVYQEAQLHLTTYTLPDKKSTSKYITTNIPFFDTKTDTQTIPEGDWTAYSMEGFETTNDNLVCLKLISPSSRAAKYIIISYFPQTNTLNIHPYDAEEIPLGTRMASPAPGLLYYLHEGCTYQYPTLCVSNPDSRRPFRQGFSLKFPGYENAYPPHQIWGDSRFLVVVDWNTLGVFCFDESSLPDGADIEI